MSGGESRDNRGRFRPGVSGNPGGRLRTIAAEVRERTGDGAELVEFLLRVVRGDDDASCADRIRAAAVLLDRGWGRVAAPPEAETGPVEVRVRYVDADGIELGDGRRY